MQNLILNSAQLGSATAFDFCALLFDPGAQASVPMSIFAAVVVSFAIALLSFVVSAIISKVGTFLGTGVKKDDDQGKE